MVGDLGPVTTISLTSVTAGWVKSTSFSRSGVTVREAAAMSPLPSTRAGRSSSRDTGMKTTFTRRLPVFRLRLSSSSNFFIAS